MYAVCKQVNAEEALARRQCNSSLSTDMWARDLKAYIRDELLQGLTRDDVITKMCEYADVFGVTTGRDEGSDLPLQWDALARMPVDLLRQLGCAICDRRPRKDTLQGWTTLVSVELGLGYGERTKPKHHRTAVCGACAKPMPWQPAGKDFMHQCKTCKTPLHSIVSDDCTKKPYMPRENEYYCNEQCAGELQKSA